MRPIPVAPLDRTLPEGPLAGAVFVITGTLSEPREAVAARIESAGGKVTDSVSGTTRYGVAGARAVSITEAEAQATRAAECQRAVEGRKRYLDRACSGIYIRN